MGLMSWHSEAIRKFRNIYLKQWFLMGWVGMGVQFHPPIHSSTFPFFLPSFPFPSFLPFSFLPSFLPSFHLPSVHPSTHHPFIHPSAQGTFDSVWRHFFGCYNWGCYCHLSSGLRPGLLLNVPQMHRIVHHHKNYPAPSVSSLEQLF